MDENTPTVIVIAAATLLAYTFVGSSAIESGTGRRVPLLARLGLPQGPRMPVWWAMLWLVFVLFFVGILQIAMLSAVIGPDRPPLSRSVGALEIGALIIWIVQMIRFVRAGGGAGQ
jgi:hypothetical protein